ncbi:MAG: RloB domain-containing protein [Rikenellaceae bacterium]
MYKQIYILCEGASEIAYIQKFSQFLRDYESDYVILPKDAGGGTVRHVKDALKKLFKENKNLNGEIWIWLDHDLYVRGDESLDELEKLCADKKRKQAQLVFNTHNFEDFLTLHFSPEIAEAWCQVMAKCGHFTSPLHAVDYAPLFKSFLKEHTNLPEYKKGKNQCIQQMDWQESLAFLKSNTASETLKQRSDMSEKILKIAPELKH